MVLKQREKAFDYELDQKQKVNAQIVSCQYYFSKHYGTIYCQERKAFVTVRDCKVCVSGRTR